MARVTDYKERLHAQLYDAFFLPEEDPPGSGTRPTFAGRMSDPRIVRFFVDVQDKTRLETNMQAAGVLPSLNTFETRAMRVVISSTTPDPAAAAPDPFIPDLIYNSVVTFLVGEKEAITAPTYMFPSGGGVLAANGGMPPNHGQPDPLATFRFAEPVFMEPQQNFRVEMLFPRGLPDTVGESLGPRRIWVVLDGYLTRDVQ